jgi:hemerythrin-like domain-containing protein
MLIKLSQVLEDLREDHRNLALLLDLLETESAYVDGDDEPDFELLHDVMQYMTVYSDAVHHPREDLVYAAMREHSAELAAGLEGIGPEHRAIAELGSTLRRDIEAIISGTAVTRERLLADLRGFVSLMRRHIAWEERDLFPAADSMALENGGTSIDITLIGDADPLFGATTAASFSNLLTHLQKHE